MAGGLLISRLYDFLDGMIVYEYHLDQEFDRIHQWLNGMLGDANIAPDANIDGTKMKLASIPVDRLAAAVTLATTFNLHLTSGDHDGRYFTETELTSGALDGRYFTETELSGGALDTRYFTEAEVNTLIGNAVGGQAPDRSIPLVKLQDPVIPLSQILAERLSATFARSSVAYLSDGTQVGTNQPRYDTVGGSSGVWVEESAQNLLTANQSSVETDLTGLLAWGSLGSVTLVHDTTKAWHGNASAKATSNHTTTQNLTIYVSEFPISPNTSYTFTVRGAASATTGRSIILNIYCKDSSGTYLLTATSVASSPAIGSAFSEYTVTVQTPASTSTCHIDMQLLEAQTGDSLWWDGALFAQKAYATSWTLGGTTRAAETLTVPTTGLSPTQGCWRQWVYVNANSKRQVAGQYNAVFAIPRGNGGFGIWANHRPDSALWQLSIRNDADAADGSPGVADSYTPDNGWSLFEVKWSATSADLVINGVKRASIANPKLPSSFGTSASVGYSNIANNYYLNTVHGQVQLLDHYPTDAESLSAYNLGANNLAWDENTIALYDWKNHLKSGFHRNGNFYIDEATVPAQAASLTGADGTGHTLEDPVSRGTTGPVDGEIAVYSGGRVADSAKLEGATKAAILAHDVRKVEIILLPASSNNWSTTGTSWSGIHRAFTTNFDPTMYPTGTTWTLEVLFNGFGDVGIFAYDNTTIIAGSVIASINGNAGYANPPVIRTSAAPFSMPATATPITVGYKSNSGTFSVWAVRLVGTIPAS